MMLSVYLFAIAWPLLMACALFFVQARRMLWRIMPLAALPALVTGLLVTEPLIVPGAWFVLGLSIGLEPVSRLFLIFTSLLWIAAGSAARHWMRDDPRATSFGVMFLLAMSGNLGLILSKDAVAFYGAFALMSFASYGLVLHSRDAAAKSAARLYIGFVVIGELILFSGLVLAATQAGSILLADMRAAELSALAVALLLTGFGIKLGVMPLHFWLPPAHGAAPVPASAVLSGAMIKAGLFGIVAAVPLGVVAYADHGTVVMAAGMVTIFAALLLGVQQGNSKPVLGFSSVSQMGIIALGLGAGLMTPEAWPAILPVLVFLAAHHGLAKGALFLGVGAWAAQSRLAARIAVTLAIAAPALVLAGLPFSSGALGKEALKSALEAGSEIWLPWLILALTLSGIATTLLMARAVALLWLAPPKAPIQASAVGLVVPFLALSAAAVLLPVIWPVLNAEMAATTGAARPGALWPVALGLAIAVASAITAYAQQIGVMAFVEMITAPFRALSENARRFGASLGHALAALAIAAPRRIESHALRWRLGQSAIAGLIAAFMLIGALAGLRDDGLHSPAVLLDPAAQESVLDLPDLEADREVQDTDIPDDALAP